MAWALLGVGVSDAAVRLDAIVRDLGAGQLGYTPGTGGIISGNFEVGIDTTNKPWPGELWIVSGPDPRVLIADEVLYLFLTRPADIHPDVTLDRRRCTDLHPCTCSPGDGPLVNRFPVDDCPQHGYTPKICLICHSGGQCFYGSLLRFVCREKTVVYRLNGHEARPPGWWGEWPD